MSVALDQRPATLSVGAGDGGGAARRAVIRWAWRLFRREWRQQVLVLVLVTVAVAATIGGVAVATNAAKSSNAMFTLPGDDPHLAADVAAFQQAFDNIDVIAHQKVAVPGSVSTFDLRAQDPNVHQGRSTLRLLAGRYPTGPGEVAVTHDVASTFSLQLGATWHQAGRDLRVVGVVENPQDLLDQFALVAPGQADPPDTVTITLDTDSPPSAESFRLHSGTPLALEASPSAGNAAAVAVLALATIGLLFVGLVAVAGFTVMAQRRLRALGMLGSLGATDRHVRLAMIANGAAVGAAGAVVGTAVGVAGWMAFAPRLETMAERRIDRFHLHWWAIGAAMVLAVVTAVAAAWWPARTAARMPVVAALSGRPPRPQPAHRFAALGGVLVATGVGLLARADQQPGPLIVTGIVATSLGVLLLAPLGIAALARLASRTPVATRLALRDLGRYQARSGAALGAVTLAVGIAATIAISASATQTTTGPTVGNLPANELIVHASTHGAGAPLPDNTPAQLQALQASIDGIATALHTTDVAALEAAVDPTAPDVPAPGGHGSGKAPAALVKVTSVPGGQRVSPVATLYVATPELLQHYGINPSQIDPTADIVTSRTDLAGVSLGYGPRGELQDPKIQTVDLPDYTSDPTTLITPLAVQQLGLQPVPAGWLIRTPQPLTAAQINVARHSAAAAGLTVETRSTEQSLASLRNWSTAVGLLVALGVLAMTVGLIRTETSNDLRILVATGATSTIRRALTAATAGALALLGALLGTAGAYLALIAWHRSDLHTLGHIPVANLIVIVVALPLAATAAGWLLAGREPPALARQPLE